MKNRVILIIFVAATATPLAVYVHHAFQPIPSLGLAGLCPKSPIWTKVPGVENVFGIPKYATKEGEGRAASYRIRNFKIPSGYRSHAQCYYERGPD